MDPAGALQIVHWFDFTCPFCYVTEDWDAFFGARGFDVMDLPFRVHPKMPPAGVHTGPCQRPIHRNIEAQARAAGLSASGARRMGSPASPGDYRAFNKAPFEAHFVLNEDLGDRATILRKAAQLGLEMSGLGAVLEDGSADLWIRESEAKAHEHGVRGTAAWLYRGRLLVGARPIEEFARFASDCGAVGSSISGVSSYGRSQMRAAGNSPVITSTQDESSICFRSCCSTCRI
jgi:predicted DsbA family dithiol-disulfide isomerase